MQLAMRRACRTVSVIVVLFLLVSSIFAYSHYLTLKKSLISKISERATAMIGQKVEIGDIYLDPVAGINIADIVIRSPEGLSEKNLLSIKKVRLRMRFSELFSGRFSFSNIEIVSPDLSLSKNEGRLNISEKFREFFSKKGTLKYQIDDLVINDAVFSFNRDPLYRIEKSALTMKNLSSETDAKTLYSASITYLAKNSLKADGWVYPKDGAKKFGIELRSDGIDLGMFKDRLDPTHIDLSKSEASISLSAEGDLKRGIMIKSAGEFKGKGLSIFGKHHDHAVSLDAESFLDINKGSLTAKKILVKTGDAASIEASVTLNNIFHDPDYSADIKIGRFDPSLLKHLTGIEAGGIISSDPIRINGRFSDAMPHADGSIFINNGSIRHASGEVRDINAEVLFSSGKEISIKAKAEGRIWKAGDIVFVNPSAIKLVADVKGNPKKILCESRFTLSDLSLKIDGRSLSAGEVGMSYSGVIKNMALSGRVSLDAKGLSYDAYNAGEVRASFGILYEKERAAVSDLRIKSGVINASGEMVSLRLPKDRDEIQVETKNLNGEYPAYKASARSLSFSATLRKGAKQPAGEFSFGAKQIMLQGIAASDVTGRGRMSDKGFMLDIPSLSFWGGNVTASAESKTGSFPIDLKVKAERINLAMADEAVGAFIKLPYRVSGNVGNLKFEGSLKSKEEIFGKAAMTAENIGLADSSKRALIKNAGIISEAVFRGRDIDIKTDISVPGISLSVSGTAEHFLSDDRLAKFSIHFPETRLEDVRTAFWDIVPDRLLYAGVSGSSALSLLSYYSKSGITAEGFIMLRDISVEGENGEYYVGPINGMLPVHYNSAAGADIDALPAYEVSDFEKHKRSYLNERHFRGNEIKIGSIRYGFRILEDISLWAEQTGSSLKINRFSANMFKGNIYGTAFIDTHGGLSYRADLIADSVSLSALCDEMPPIKGYISGRINGLAAIKGKGAGLDHIIGKADFWTYSAEGDKTKISREFLEKIGGPQVKAYLGERPFNRGIMGVYIQNGFLIFRELEISNRNLVGITDLSVKVAPLNNRIGIDHLMWTIIEAAQRAKKE